MAEFTSKELYIMNGGNKLYIYKDGFADQYHATAAEEAEWKQEVIDASLERVNKEINGVGLRFAIDNLIFHNYPGTEQLLRDKLKDPDPKRVIVFAMMLWIMNRYEKSFGIIYQLFLYQRDTVLDGFFTALIEFKFNISARMFLFECLRGDDPQLKKKAQTTIGMWAYTGMPELRNGDLHERLKSADEEIFKAALLQLRQMFMM